MKRIAALVIALAVSGCVVVSPAGLAGSGASSSHPHGGPPGKALGHQTHAKHNKKCGHSLKKHKGRTVFLVDGNWVDEVGVAVTLD